MWVHAHLCYPCANSSSVSLGSKYLPEEKNRRKYMHIQGWGESVCFAHKHSIGLLLSGVVRFNQNSRRKHKICYCPKIFPYPLVSTLVKDNISYYQSLKIVNNIFTFYTSCLFLLNISLTCFSLSTIYFLEEKKYYN